MPKTRSGRKASERAAPYPTTQKAVKRRRPCKHADDLLCASQRILTKLGEQATIAEREGAIPPSCLAPDSTHNSFFAGVAASRRYKSSASLRMLT